MADGWSAASLAVADEESATDGAWHKVGAISGTPRTTPELLQQDDAADVPGAPPRTRVVPLPQPSAQIAQVTSICPIDRMTGQTIDIPNISGLNVRTTTCRRGCWHGLRPLKDE